jgi:hypothetical protein
VNWWWKEIMICYPWYGKLKRRDSLCDKFNIFLLMTVCLLIIDWIIKNGNRYNKIILYNIQSCKYMVFWNATNIYCNSLLIYVCVTRMWPSLF